MTFIKARYLSGEIAENVRKIMQVEEDLGIKNQVYFERGELHFRISVQIDARVVAITALPHMIEHVEIDLSRSMFIQTVFNLTKDEINRRAYTTTKQEAKNPRNMPLKEPSYVKANLLSMITNVDRLLHLAYN